MSATTVPATGARSIGPEDPRRTELRVVADSAQPDHAKAWRATLHDFELKLPCEGKAAWWARTWLRSIDVPLQQDGQEQLRLLAHELLRNSVEHSGSDEMTIRVEVQAAAVRVIVTDDGTGSNLTPREVEPFACSGRGLRWVDHLADAWGIDRSGHTAVWFEMNRCKGKDQAAGSGAATENS